MQLAQTTCTSLLRKDEGVGLENRCCWRWEIGGIRFITGLESEFMEFMDGATPETEEAKFLPDAEDMESSDDSIDGNGSKSLSRLRWFSYGGGVNALCKGEAA